MNLDDALAEKIFDQMKDGADMALQQPVDGGKFPVDVDFGLAAKCDVIVENFRPGRDLLDLSSKEIDELRTSGVI